MHGYKMYQTTWQGIDLADIASSLDVKPNELAAEHFYDEFYKRLYQDNYNIKQEWIDSKHEIGYWLKNYIDDLEKEYKRKVKIISVGAGLGIVEEVLIEKNYDIEIQECQNGSFDYLHNKGIQPKKEWITCDLNDLPAKAYDVVFINNVVYAFDNQQYYNLLIDINRMLKHNGQLIVIEPVALIKSKIVSIIKTVLKALKVNKVGVFWGWVRTPNEHQKIAEAVGLKSKNRIPFSSSGRTEKDSKLLFGYSTQNNSIVSYGYVFTKEEKV